jgi:putative membrane protein
LKQLDPNVAAQLTDAIHALERRSCAEVVVEIRARSGSYAHADARFGATLAFAALLLLLFSPWTFAPLWVAIDVALVYALGIFLARRTAALRRLMTSTRERQTAVRTVATAVFVDRGIANTRAETGVLVYLSLLERRIELIADRGVLQSVPSLAWNQLLAAAHARSATIETLVEILRALDPLLECHLPWRDGDVDELHNEPRFVIE